MIVESNSELLATELRQVVGNAYVHTGRAEVGVFELDASDESISGIHQPDAVVLPATTEEVSAVVKTAVKHNLPVVARGAGTGLAGGAVTTEGGILIVTARMNSIEEVHLVDRYAIVQPGVINLDLSEHLASSGYYYAPDPASQKTCTIGGNIANNSGGPHCLKYGVTTNHILGVEMVLDDGEVVWWGGPSSENPGFDLTRAVVGSEGTLGIVTKAVVRILPLPETKGVLLAAYESIATASRAVSATIAAGIIPAAMEMMDAKTIEAIEVSAQAGYPKHAAAVLLVELDGAHETIEFHRKIVAEILAEHGAIEVRDAETAEEQARLWLGRKSAFGAMGRLAPNYHLTDTVVPRSKLPIAMEEVAEIAEKYDLLVANVFHAGDGNLHPLILFDRNEPGIMQRVLDASDELMASSMNLGGAVSGEHGIGIEKQNALPLMFSDDDLEAMGSLKRSFDPDNICNPGKVFPSGFEVFHTKEAVTSGASGD